MIKAPRTLLFVLLVLAQGPSFGEERIQLNRTTVIDNHELPKVTYIVPWQAAPLPEQAQPPLDTLIDYALTPLDRDVLRSQIQYYYQVTPPAQIHANSPEKKTE